MKRRLAATILLTCLSGCYAAPPPALPLGPLVAVPGPDRTEADFRQDDAACRSTLPPPAALQPAPTSSAPTSSAPAQPAPRQAAPQPALAPTVAQPAPPDSPGVAYLRCMSAKGEVIEPWTPQLAPLAYAYYPAYPAYAGFDYGFPVFFGGFGFYGRGFYGGGYYGGFHHDGFYRGGYRGFRH